MPPSLYQRAAEIFDSARALPPADRAAYIDRACAGDTALRDLVAELLEYDSRPLALDDAALAPAHTGAASPIPDRIGRYRVIDVLGVGGMSVVYRARQDNPDRDVAIKVLRTELRSPAATARFVHEAQILARLQHPGIAHVLEAGVHQFGHAEQPFFAMELINGRPITRDADENNLTKRQRLELLARICDAVDHAHQRGVIHRDLKPANILVDERGQPKILDFGIARLSDADLRAATMHTSTGQLLGTLAYMSPEQIEADPHNIDRRTDIYALGVIGYELLTGARPLDIDALSIPEAARVIRDDEPTRLGTLDRSLRGDVETIIATAMAKEPDRRYPSASELAKDIGRYLRDDPIDARPPSVVYQWRKLARRNKALVGAVATVIVVLAAATAVSATMAYQRTHALAAETEARERAQIEASKAQNVTVFLERTLLAASPMGRMGITGPEVTLADYLESAVTDLESLDADPEVEAHIRLTIGTAYKELGRYKEAEPLLREALAIRQRVLVPHHPMIAEAKRQLGVTLARDGRIDEGIELLESSLTMMRTEFGDQHPDVAKAQADLGWCLLQRGRLDQAGALFASAHTTLRADPETNPDLLATLLANKGALAKQLGDAAAAKAHYSEALQILGPDHTQSALIMGNLGTLHYALGEYEDAAREQRDAINILERRLAPNHPLLGATLNNLALSLSSLGRHDEAIDIQRRVLDISREHHGENSHDYIITLGNTAYDLYMSDRLVESGQAYGRVAAWYKQHEPDSPKGPLRGVYEAELLAGRAIPWDDAQRQILADYERLVQLIGDEHPYAASARRSLVKFYERWEKPGEAAKYKPQEDVAG